MHTASACAHYKSKVPPDRVATLRLLLLATCLLLFTADISSAGECLMSDEDLYQGVASFAESAKKGGMGSPYYDSDLYCWSGSSRLTPKLRAVLTDLMFDSRIHPAHVAAALNDYQTVFGDPGVLLDEVKKKQGKSRYEIISSIRVHKEAARSQEEVAGTFPDNVDFIDGPANIRKEPKGNLVASLPDNTKVRILRKQDAWVEIASDGVRGWTARTNLMSSHVGAVDADGFYVLSRAAFMGYFETVRFLLSRSAQPDLVDGFGRNALHWAVRGGFASLTSKELEMVKLLAAVPGINVNHVDAEGLTPLLTAITIGRPDVLNVLIGMNAIDVNGAGTEGVTPLMRAIEYRKPAMVNALLSARGVNVDATDENGRTALFHAVAINDLASAKMLLDRNARTDTITKNGKTLLHAMFVPLPWRLTADLANMELAKFLVARKDIDINKMDEKGDRVMALAIEQDNAALVKLLLTRPDLDVNKPMPNGSSYLHRVIGLSNLRHGYEMAMALLDRPEIDVNARGYRGRTVVFMDWYNIGYGEHGIALAKKILARNPDVNVRDDDGKTPLIYTVEQDYPDMVRLLSAAPGIDLDLPETALGKTPLGMAKYRGRPAIVEILTKAGAREFALIGNPGKTPEGIPQALLQTESAYQAIVFYRDYLLQTTGRTLQRVRTGDLDEAVKGQEFILDEIIFEVSDSLPKYSIEQRARAKKIFGAIAAYYRKNPRPSSAWYRALTDQQKAEYAKVDTLLAEVLAGKYDALPDGEFKNHPPMVPILIIRDYMAQNSIDALKLIRDGKKAAAEQLLQTVIERSTSKHQVRP